MNRLHKLLVLCTSQLVLFTQAGWAADNYHPLPNVQEDENIYTLTLNTIPKGAGSFNYDSGSTFTAGQSVYLYYYANNDYVFDYWQTGDTVISRDNSFYFTMPNHDATLTAVFHYTPDSPGNPDMPDNEKKYTLTLNTIPPGAGSFNYDSGNKFNVGQSIYMYNYANTDYVFDYWQTGDTIISRNRNFYYTMPDHDATLTAVYNYNPGNPADPDTAQVYYTVTLQTQPAGAGSFSWNTTTQRVAGSSGYIYAYNNTDYIFREWQLEGKTVGTDRQYYFNMPAQNINLVAVYDYRPANPGNPGKNYWNEETGEVIVDDFNDGNLYDAVYYATNGNYDAVQMITVAGPVSQYDWGVANNYNNCTFLDMSRTHGLSYVPSYNFYGNQKLTNVVLPADIEAIDYYAFYDCSSLSSISVYAATPPTIGYYAFYGIADSIVYVPADALSLYQEAEGWKDFTILPLAKDVNQLEVNLPEGTDVETYKDMYIELLNVKSGQKLRYVITNRLTYTFNSLVNKTSYIAYLRNSQGDVLGQIDGIDIVDKDVSVTFPSLMVPRDLSLTVLTPTGQDVTGQTTITWYGPKDTYLTKGSILKGQLEGVNVKYRVQLSQALGMQYLLPADVTYLVQSANELTLTLADIPQETIGGKVIDIKSSQPISGATITVSQMLNGLYSKSFTTKTDKNGQWSLQVYEASTNITASMDNYVSKTQTFETLVADVPAFELKDINGTTISLNLTYQPTGGELQQYYSDYANVAYTVSIDPSDPLAAQNPQLEYNVQYPQIVLMEQHPAGTLLRVTATSKNQKFVPVTAIATVDDLDRANVTLPIVQLGGISASFRQTENLAVVGILYDGNGRLIKKYDYTTAKLNINELQDGQYTLVTMASSQLFNTVGSLSQFTEAGLREGVDFVKNTVTVSSGVMTAINNAFIPFLDETKLYYTGNNTSVTVNKSQITTGNYLTVTGKIDFKSAYADQVSDVKFIVDLPEESAFVENSAMRGGQTATYTYLNNQVVVPLDFYGERVRFCFIPTVGGDFTATGSVQFTLNGKTVTQPIGKVNYMVKDLSVNVPSTVAKTTVPVSGTAIGKSTIDIYDNGILVGHTTSLANGEWETTCELNEPYNLSTHNIYARVTTKAGMELISETKQVIYDMNNVVPEKVTMLYYNPEFVGQYNIVFDLINGTVNPSSFYFFPYKNWPNWYETYETEPKDFTFIADLTNNDTTVVRGVTIRVYTDKGNWRNLKAKYDKSIGKWVAVSQFTSSELPVGVKVKVNAQNVSMIDAGKVAEIISDYEDFRITSAEFVNEVEDISQRLSELRRLDIPNIEEEQKLTMELSALLGLDTSFDVDDDPLDEEALISLINEVDNHLNDSIAKMFDNFLVVELNSVNDNSLFDGLSYSSAEGLDSLSLINEGYECIQKTDGTNSFIKVEDGIFSFVDFSQDICVTIEDNTFVADLNRAILRAPLDFDAIMRSYDSKITQFANGVKSSVDNLMDVADKIFNVVDAIISDLNSDWTKLNKSYQRIQINKAAGFAYSDWYLNYLDTRMTALEGTIAKLVKARDFLTKLKVGKVVGSSSSLLSLFTTYLDMRKSIDKLVDLYYSIPECETSDIDDRLRTRVYNFGIGAGVYYVGTVATDAAAIASAVVGTTAAPATLGASLAGVGVGLLKIAANVAASAIYENRLNNMINEVNSQKKFKCPDDENDGDDNDNGDDDDDDDDGDDDDDDDDDGDDDDDDDPPYPRVDPMHDPSGYVYEGVASNRLQGVTATVYYKETVEDMYGDLHENIVLWDAAEYAQENPQFTDEYGMYRWDVPQGLWQVKYEKEGYLTAYSEWLPVPPPQLEVNIGMTQMLQPSVVSAKAYDEGIEVVFDKYMNPATLTPDNIILTRNGELADGVVELLDEELAYEGQTQTYASKVRFTVPEDDPLLSTDAIYLTVRKQVESYAGMQMQDDFTQTFEVEPKVRTIAVDELINVAYGGDRTLIVAALPADASKGKKMYVKSLSTMIATTESEELTLDENGQAELKVNGELPGSTVISFTVDDSDVKGSMTVNVKDAAKLVTLAPRASRVSGTEVYRGTVIRLTSETEGAEIWYTLDGSCPCNSETALKYNPDEPIIIATDNVVIKALAQGEDLEESDVAEFNYKLKTTTLGYQLPEGWTWISHNVEESVPASTFQTGAERIVSQTAEIINDPNFGFIGTLRELEPAVGYKIQQKSEGNVRLSGYEWDAVSQIVPLETGWNWIGYPLNQTMTLNEALAFFKPNEGDYIVGQNGFGEFAGGEWHGTLEGMIPGEGFLYKSISSNEITFNTTIVSNASSRIGKRMVLTDSPWAVDKHAYPNIAPLTAYLNIDGVQNTDGGFVVAAFSDSECRGVGQWQEGRLLMNIYGEGGEQLHFLAYDTQTESVYDISESIVFGSEPIGSWNVPYMLNVVSGTTSIDDLYSELSVTPGVIYDHVTVTVGGHDISRLSLTDMSGRTVFNMNVNDKGATIATSQLPEGVYILTVVAEGRSYYHKFVKANR